MATKKMTMGLIVGNRGFFPDHLAKMAGRRCFAVAGRGWTRLCSLPKRSSTEPWRQRRIAALRGTVQEASGAH